MTPVVVSADYRTALVSIIPQLRRFALSLRKSQHHADDLVQETLLVAWNKRDELRDFATLRPWCFSILRNAYLMERRQAHREIEDVDGVHAAAVAVQPRQENDVAAHQTLSALRRLPVDQREAMMLIYVERVSYEEAAAILGCAIGTIKSRISRARAKLVAELDIATVLAEKATAESAKIQASGPKKSGSRAAKQKSASARQKPRVTV